MDLTPGLRRDPPPDLDAIGEDADLVRRIAAEIDAGGPMPFARFMDLALYDPRGGYYRSDEARPGRAGDFLTAPEAHPIFGWAIARLVDDVWQRLGRPDDFVLREFGAGTGTLAVAILDGLQRAGSGLAATVRYQPVEVEQRRIDAIAARLHAAGWSRVLHAPTDPGPRPSAGPIRGVVLANEVLDALPVHRVRRRGDHLVELAVARSTHGFREVEIEPTTPELGARLDAEGIDLADGQTAEIALAADGWVRDVAAGLGRGLLLLIDYGAAAPALYDPVRRRDGTLSAYLRHRVHDDPYIHVGRQDLTAHVDLTAVERAATVAGLEHLGTTTQAEFLVGLGAETLLRAIQVDPATTMEAYLAVRSALMRLLDPAAMGRFAVLAFGRGWPAGPPPAGFDYQLRRPGR